MSARFLTIKFFYLSAACLLTVYGVFAARSMTAGSLLFWEIWLVFTALVYGLLQNNIWCARLLAIPPLLVFLFSAPAVLYNFFAFMLGHPLYQDSPATIIIVAISALFITMPSGVLLVAYWRDRKQIFGGNNR